MNPENRRFDYKNRIGEQTLVKKTPNQPAKGYFYCKTCDVSFNDSVALAEHYNSPNRKINRQPKIGNEHECKKIGFGVNF